MNKHFFFKRKKTCPSQGAKHSFHGGAGAKEKEKEKEVIQKKCVNMGTGMNTDI
jgi:hypothetical protein